MLVPAALVLLAAWIALLVAVSRAAASGRPADAARGRAWNRLFLVATLLASIASCAAPIVPLLEGFDAVAVAPPAEKAALLQRVLDEDSPRMPLGPLAIAVLAAGTILFFSNGRRLRALAARPPEPEAQERRTA